MLELLAPAGSPEALDAAVGAGADAVYLGLKAFNARLRSVNFAYPQFEGALRGLHRMGKRLYVTVNTVFEQREADRMYQLLKYLSALGPDGLIVQDFGVISLVREHFPNLALHGSTQMNIASARGVNLLSKYGVSRTVLARELSIEEIHAIRMRTNAELEIFVHGALCVSASGLCLFSSYLGGKSANRGMCTQACRRFYRRSGRTGQAESGGYFFSPADLQLLESLPAIAAAGVNACKIEGRMKSAEYVGAVVSAYRLVIDALGGTGYQDALEKAGKILRNDFARTKTSFFFASFSASLSDCSEKAVSEEENTFSEEDFSEKNISEEENFSEKENFSEEKKFSEEETSFEEEKEVFIEKKEKKEEKKKLDWLAPEQSGGTGISLGKILKVRGGSGGLWGFLARGEVRPAAGDSARFHRADDSVRRSFKVTAVEEAPDGVWIPVPEGFGRGDAAYLIQTKAMTKRYKPVMPRDLSGFRRVPGRDSAPVLSLPGPKKRGAKPFPPGIYASVSRIEDLYMLQSVRPAGVFLAYNRKTARRLLGETAGLPFPPRELILALDPYFPQDLDRVFAEELPELMRRGYRRFMVNNLGHFSYFRGEEADLIAGPYLYVFNRWANAFIGALGTDYFVSPLENNRQNLERTVDLNRRIFTFITVFAYPALFRIRADLSGVYDFGRFSGGRGESFFLACASEGSQVLPERAFSIIDKIPFLEEAGFSRFIIDISGFSMKKNDYKDLMRSVGKAEPLSDASRFNWKDGFYREG
jgi:putative protease